VLMRSIFLPRLDYTAKSVSRAQSTTASSFRWPKQKQASLANADGARMKNPGTPASLVPRARVAVGFNLISSPAGRKHTVQLVD
jgi:hypothetical protein